LLPGGPGRPRCSASATIVTVQANDGLALLTMSLALTVTRYKLPRAPLLAIVPVLALMPGPAACKLALPLPSVAVPSSMPPSLNVTVPVGGLPLRQADITVTV
jgi:hypothetical protein